MVPSQPLIPLKPSKFGNQYQQSNREGKTDQCANSLQLQGELRAKKDAPRLYRGAFHGVGVILRNEGPKGLYRGIGAAVTPCVDDVPCHETNACHSTFTR